MHPDVPSERPIADEPSRPAGSAAQADLALDAEAVGRMRDAQGRELRSDAALDRRRERGIEVGAQQLAIGLHPQTEASRDLDADLARAGQLLAKAAAHALGDGL